MAERDDWNRKIIEEFRDNEGRVGGPFEGMPMILVHSTGAKSGAERVHPMVYQAVGDAWAVFASKAGAPTNPDWYHNLVAHPNATAELGTDTVQVTARVVSGDERERIWSKQKTDYPGFAEYEAKTAGIREIPVIVLERRD